MNTDFSDEKLPTEQIPCLTYWIFIFSLTSF